MGPGAKCVFDNELSCDQKAIDENSCTEKVSVINIHVDPNES